MVAYYLGFAYHSKFQQHILSVRGVIFPTFVTWNDQPYLPLVPNHIHKDIMFSGIKVVYYILHLFLVPGMRFLSKITHYSLKTAKKAMAMSLTNQVLKRIPHNVAPQQLLVAAISCFIALLLASIVVIYHAYGSVLARVTTIVILCLCIRWVYWNGVGVLGWTNPWLRNSNFVIKSLCSDPQQQGTLRVVCISDTHAKHRNLQSIPSGDLLIHCGDFTQRGTHEEIRDFNAWLGVLPHKYKVIIAGNHDVCMDAVEYNQHWDKEFRHKEYNDPSHARALLSNCTYLENRSIIIEGLKIYGSPMTPPIPGRVGAFHVARGFAEQQHWAKVPADVDILVTHGPPHGILDTTFTGQHVGSETLLKETMSRIRPRYHIFGHIHEAYGATRVGETVFLNAATSTLLAKLCHEPIVLDIPVKC